MDWLDLSITPEKNHKSYYFYNPQKIGVSTLKNLGNTCYFNSVLQCLCHTIPLANYILKGEYEKSDKFFDQFAKLVKTMWYSNYQLTPSSIHTSFKILKKKNDDNQEDAHEVLGFLIDHFHEALKYNVIYKDLNDNSLVKASLKELKAIPMSPINNIFMGQLHQRIQCQSCRHTSHSFPIFKDIILRPEANTDYQYLYGLLNSFCCREVIDDYACEKCNQKDKAYKRTTFWRLPQVLIIVLARFDHMKKNNKQIDYPITTFDLTKYISYPDDSRHIYNLYAISCHIGATQIGHYYSIAKINNEWVILNDESVEYITKKDELVTSHAYILFYQRQNNSMN